jgi:AraC-like DNA-binding protein
MFFKHHRLMLTQAIRKTRSARRINASPFPDDGDRLSSQLRRLLSRDSARWPDLEAVAAHMHISPQTLRRHLREEGTSFQELKDQLRRDIAIYHLGRADLSLQQIAEQLGFSEPSAFHRAFKKWTGLTPGAYRAQEN